MRASFQMWMSLQHNFFESLVQKYIKLEHVFSLVKVLLFVSGEYGLYYHYGEELT
jgi:hypothetical protein